MSGHRYAGSLSTSLVLMMGISRSYLWKIETGTADVGIDVLIGIARALDIPVRELVDF
ncbi:helix-turn-helix domain-containing protein [Enorma phocaeensis]|uniref:helix-turn-helix domain-containing protein n=1 Tax=Enorma phocaeensis TaxID=1871019 RepID=UPI0023570AB4|nr:helix-turn-helix transcriptional regulator [Enorma phocaeensis]